MDAQLSSPTSIATPVSGEPFAASLLTVDDKWNLRFATPAGERAIAAAELVCWGTPAEAERAQLVFADGDILVAEVQSADQDNAVVLSSLFGRVTVPLELLRGIIFQPPVDRAARDQLLFKLLESTDKSDRLLLANGDELTGTIQALARTDGEEHLEVRLQSPAGAIDIRADRVAAIAFNPSLSAPRNFTGLRATVGFRDGTLLTTQSLVVGQGKAKLRIDKELTVETASADVVSLQIAGGQAMYLSDLKAESYRHVPFLSLSWPYFTDRNVEGSRLRCGQRLYLKGLGMHSAARITYNLDGRYRRFETELAIDDAAERQGSVTFRVFVDGEQKHQSPDIRGGDPPVATSIGVAGGKQLSLVVDYGQWGDTRDLADWLNARLVP